VLAKQVVGSIVVLFEPFSAIALAKLLHLRKEIVNVRLRLLRSVLDVSESQDSPIRLLHPSFRDFLLDNQRCRDQHFWTDEKVAHKSLAQNCLKLMHTYLRKDVCGLCLPGTLASDVSRSQVEQCLPQQVQYACLYWVQHLQKSIVQLYDDDRVHKFLREHLLHWLEALSLMRKTSEGVLAIISLESLVVVSKPGCVSKGKFGLTNEGRSEPPPARVHP
jgi:hypothetical protein